MKPNAKEYNPDPAYLAELVKSAGMTRADLAERLGYDERTLRRWLAGERKFPYAVQFALECIVLEV